MKKLIMWIAVIAGIFIYLAIIGKCNKPREIPTEKLKQIMSAEPKVKDYVLTDVNFFYALVLDDGTNRDAFAQYLYYTLKSGGVLVEKVIIVKLGTQKHSKKDNVFGIQLGEFQP